MRYIVVLNGLAPGEGRELGIALELYHTVFAPRGHNTRVLQREKG